MRENLSRIQKQIQIIKEIKKNYAGINKIIMKIKLT